MASKFIDLAQQPLSSQRMMELMEQMIQGSLSTEEMVEVLRTLAARGETAEEIAAAVAVLRRHAVPLPLKNTAGLCDTCGTGGDRVARDEGGSAPAGEPTEPAATINVSTLGALVAASCGVRISKHGNRAASSRCGSADVLEALGVNLDATPEQVAACIDGVGIGFCFAPRFHPAMKAVAPARKQLGIRTIFNLIGPLANPAPLTYQLVGVADSKLLTPLADALIRLGIRRGLVVHGLDGLDEVTTTAETDALEILDGKAGPLRLRPEDCGLKRAILDELRGGDATENARLATAVLRGAASAQRDLVALNAGCAIYIAEQAPSLLDGVRRALEALKAGAPFELLQWLVKHSHA